MFNWIRRRVLRFAHLPHDPTSPSGAPGSVRVFRAGRNYYKLKLCRWGIGQVGAVVGIFISLWFIAKLEGDVRELQTNRPAGTAQSPGIVVARSATNPQPETPASRKERRRDVERDLQRRAAQVVASGPTWIVSLIRFLEYAAIVIFILQLPVSFAAVRLDFELHWYIVTDRSLRIRTGLFKVQESTMSFANLQQIEMKQGPVQRLLGLGDVHVQSAGGGDSHKETEHDSLHTGIFHSVDNAPEIRDLIVERLRQFRQAGLGDPDDHHASQENSSTPPSDPLMPPVIGSERSATLAAAEEVLAEARALRRALS